MSSPLEFVIRLEEGATPAFDVGGLPVPSSTPSSQPSPPQEDPARKALEDAQLADLQRRSLATASGREADASLSQSASVSDLLAAQMAELQQQHAQAVRRASESAAESAAAGFVGGRSDIRRVQQLEAQMAELQRQIAAPQVEEIRPELDIRPEPLSTPAFNLQPVQEVMRDLDRDLAANIHFKVDTINTFCEELKNEAQSILPSLADLHLVPTGEILPHADDLRLQPKEEIPTAEFSDPYQVPQQKGLFGPPEPPPLAITPQVEADKRQKDAALRANFEADILRSRDVDEDARRMKQQADSREEYNKDLQQARNRLDPEDARERDMKAAGNLAQQAGVPGGRALGNISEASKLPEALEGIGEAGGLEAAAGPIGAVIAIADEAGKALAGQMDGARKSIELFGQTVGDAVRNDYVTAFNRNIDATAESLKKIPIAGQVWAAELELAVAPLRTFTDLVRSFNDRGAELAKYSAEISLARAQAEFRGTMADIHEADVLGPGIARLTTASDAVWHEFRAMFLPLKEFIVETLAVYLEAIVEAIPYIKANLKAIVDLLAYLAQKLTPWTNNMEEILRAISRGLEAKDGFDMVSPIDIVSDILGGRAAFDPRMRNASRPLWTGDDLGVPGVRGGF